MYTLLYTCVYIYLSYFACELLCSVFESSFCHVLGPWCFTTDAAVRWEYCDIKQCGKCPRDVQSYYYI